MSDIERYLDPERPAFANPEALDSYVDSADRTRYVKPPEEVMEALEERANGQRNYEVCGAWNDRRFKVCERPAMSNGRCSWHGGKSLKGANHPKYEGKGFSKYLPLNIRKRFEESLEDPELLELRKESALLDARLKEVVSEMDIEASRKTWKKLRKHWRKLVEARDNNDAEEVIKQFEKVGDLIETGSERQEKWDDVSDVIKERRMVNEAEQKRLQQMNQMVTYEQVMMLIQTMVKLVVDTHRKYEIKSEVTRDLSAKLTSIASRSDRTEAYGEQR